MADDQGVSGFAELKAWAKALPDQVMGRASSVCDTGDEYVEFVSYGLARPGDEEVIERSVAQQMQLALSKYFSKRSGRIYWRIPIEVNIHPTHVVVRYDENGPDVDHITGRRCVKDQNWVRLACYARLYRARLPLSKAA